MRIRTEDEIKRPGLIHFIKEEYLSSFLDGNLYLAHGPSFRKNGKDSGGRFDSDEVDLQKYQDVWDVSDRVPEFLEDIYNERRVHSKLDYVSPNEFEEKNEEDKKNGNVRPVLKL